MPGDFDGDGKADLVIYETATSAWTFRLSSRGYASFTVVF
ncbi:MAG: FG-GAP repeat protein [Lentisphaerae bacterium]|nr:FG-GAP repeat protein [Lentisphaerota bacterium]